METEFALSLGSQRWTLPADGDTITIGRGSNADIRLPSDDQISRIHARLDRSGTTWTLVDESRNGTALNGRRLGAPTALTNNDRIHIGRSVLTFHEPAPRPAATPPPSPTSTPTPAPASAPTPAPAVPPTAGVSPVPPIAVAPSAPPAAPPAQTAPAADGSSPAPTTTPRPDATTPAPAGGLAAGDAPASSPQAPPAQTGQGGANPSTPPQGGVVDPSARSAGAVGNSPSYDGSGGAGPAFWDDLAGEAGPRDEWVDEAPVGWVDVEASGPGGDAAWAAYPSADNPEPARSPWSEGKRPALVRPEGGPDNWSESSGWPDSAFDQQQPAPTPTPRQPEQPVRRGPAAATEDSAVGRVRLGRTLLVAAAVLGLGLIINVVATFFADGAGGSLRWLVPPTIALVAAMVVALLDAIASEDRPRSGRLDVPVLVAIGAVLVAVGIGGFALTAGVEYAAAYVTGKESGEDRLIKPVARTGAGVTVTVENVTYTSHFTRVKVSVSNGSDQPLRLPLDGQAAFTGADGNSLKADGSRSQWTDSVAPGAVERGTITFTGHLPEGETVATLTLRSGNPAIAVPGLALSN
ncbi:FHA domain-containing protein [Kribbella sp. NPDC050470]|uniref:FHA domain-containing protein n=1 Tax=unclassified Kribbella TaxID=2644121 RepID=UPI0037920BF8